MGYANHAALNKDLAKTHDNVVLIDAGDAILGVPIGTLSGVKYIIDIHEQGWL